MIPLTLVLRDLVPQDADVTRIRQLVEQTYPESLRALVPSFKFSNQWFDDLRNPQLSTANTKNPLWKLPMTVWTIDSLDDYETVAAIVTKDERPLPMASAVVANRPMELLY